MRHSSSQFALEHHKLAAFCDKNMPATSTKRSSAWTGHVDCGKDTLILSFMDNDCSLPYCAIIMIVYQHKSSSIIVMIVILAFSTITQA